MAQAGGHVAGTAGEELVQGAEGGDGRLRPAASSTVVKRVEYWSNGGQMLSRKAATDGSGLCRLGASAGKILV